MKKIFNIVLLFLCSVGIFTACEDDNDSNPILVQPTEFVLNEPAYAADGGIDLAHSENINLSWSQPVYTNNNAPLVVTYAIQVSPTGSFTHSYEEAQADETGATVADYAALESTTTQCKAAASASELAKALQQVALYKEDAVPASQDVYVRIYASVSGLNPIVSNTVKLNVVPYYVELKDAPIEMWYLLGDCIGDGTWSNSSAANVGTSIFPMSIKTDAEYSKKTGQGVLVHTGYFPAGKGFKLIKTVGSWDDQWGMTDGAFVKNDGGSGNISVSESGYYTLTLDTQNDVLTLEKADITPTVYDGMAASGDFNSWGDSEMTAFNTTGDMAGHNHLWSYVCDASAGATTLKFKIVGSWDTNWGSATFPQGIGVSNGDNIPVSEGKWVVTFNDIDGSYYFTAQ